MVFHDAGDLSGWCATAAQSLAAVLRFMVVVVNFGGDRLSFFGNALLLTLRAYGGFIAGRLLGRWGLLQNMLIALEGNLLCFFFLVVGSFAVIDEIKAW